MSHPTERGKSMQAINTQLLNDIEDVKIRQLRGVYWNEPSKARRPSFNLLMSLRS